MNCSRRSWIRGLIGALPILAFWQRTVMGQAQPQPLCEGTVSDSQGKGIANLVVQIVEPTGRIRVGKTNAQGVYHVPVPPNGAYVVVFREPQGSARLLDVRQLTAGTSQKLSVTIDPPTKSCQGAYGALQAVESLSAWAVGDRDNKVAPLLFETISFNELMGFVETVIKNVTQIEPTRRQSDFLSTKAETVRRLLEMTR